MRFSSVCPKRKRCLPFSLLYTQPQMERESWKLVPLTISLFGARVGEGSAQGADMADKEGAAQGADTADKEGEVTVRGAPTVRGWMPM